MLLRDHYDIFSILGMVSIRTPNPAGYPKCSNLKDLDLENMTPIH